VVQLSFTDGLHLAVGSAAGFLLVGAACVAVLMRGSSVVPPQPPPELATRPATGAHGA
jgi:hypothetical protein